MSQTSEAAARLRKHAETVSALTQPLNEVPEGHDWTRGRILRHVVMTAKPYLAGIEEALNAATPGKGERTTFFGQKLCGIAGPSGSTPVPSKLVPPEQNEDLSVLVEFGEVYRRLAEMAERGASLDLRKANVRLPLIPVFRLTPLDAFLLHAAHADRHVAQVLRPGHSSRH